MLILGGILWLLPLMNLNQWEILTLYCNFPFMLRVFLFTLLFYLLDRFFHRDEGSWGGAVGLIVFGVFAMLACGQGYLFGVFAGVAGVVILDMCLGNRKALRGQQIAILAAYALAVIFYLATLLPEDLEGSGIVLSAWDYFKGFLIALGSTLMPNSFVQDALAGTYAVGALILVLTIVALIRYFRSGMYRRTCLPLFLLIYAFVSIIAMEYGRAGFFGIISMSSSRYVVETTLGILGLVMIYWDWFTAAWRRGRPIRYLALLAALAFIVIFLQIDQVEWEIAYFRQVYGNEMIDIAYRVDEVPDEDLAIFQSEPDAVRMGLAIMEENELCIFSPEYISRGAGSGP